MKSLFSLLTAALLCASTAQAGQLLDLSVTDRDTGASLPVHGQGGKLYVAGVPGHRYSVRLSNRSGQRVLAVLSVDGVNAVTGETANPNQSGYVLDAFESTEVAGWRKSLDEVAQFNFTALSDSYAGKTGRPGNVGVIGVAVFRERQPVWREDKIAAQPAQSRRKDSEAGLDERSAARPSPPASAAPTGTASGASADAQSAPRDSLAKSETSVATKRASEPLGTGHGEREYAHVDQTTFEREGSRPNEVLSVFYDSYRNLVARGVIREPRPLNRDPQAFPAGFVPDPTH
jgi:hypothetical protein